MTQAVQLVPVDARTADWPRKVATALNRLQNTALASGGSATWGGIAGTLSAQTDLQSALNAKQATLVSGTNIKTVNSTALLGSGNLSVGTVTSVSVVTANGVSGSVATATSTPAITLTLGAITPSSVAASGTITGSNLSGTNTGDQTSVTGNAGTATALQTGRTIAMTGDVTWNSGTFNGTANVTAAGTIANSAVTLAKIANAAANSKLLGSGASGSGSAYVELTLGTNLSMSGTTLNASGGGSLSDADYGDITVSGSGTVLTIDNNVVTYAKMQDVSATSRILGRKTASAGDTEECTLSEILDFIGSAAQGDILYRGASAWARLGAGTSGQVLQTLGTGANPAWATPTKVLITETTTSGTATNVTFSSIPATYRDIEIRVRGRGTGAVFSQNLLVQFNGDTGNNYHWDVEQGQGAANVVAQTLATASGGIGLFPGASATANYAGASTLTVIDYRGTTFFKVGSSLNAMSVANAGGSIVSGSYGVQWLSTAAITSVKVFLATGNFVDGSIVSLYGIL